MRSVEEVLGDLVANTPDDEIPHEARSAAVRQLLDCVGVAIAAAGDPAGQTIASVTEVLGGAHQARVLGTSVRTSVVQSAWANGSLAHLLDFDDTGFSHPTACLMPAALAIGEWLDMSGHELVASMVLGYEVFERLAVCARPCEPVLRRRGIHPTSVWGAPAAAVAGRLLHLDQGQIMVALGIAAGGAFGITQQFGSRSKGLAAGNAARAGITAALLAKDGYEGDERGISGSYGLISAVIGEGNYDVSRFDDELGKRWAVADPGISIKPYPACTSTLRAVDAMLKIATMPLYSADAVESIAVDVHPDLLHTLRFRSPEQGFRGKFSLDYTVAAVALDGHLSIESFSNSAAQRPAFRAMLERVDLRLHPEWDISRRHETPVAVTFTDGRVLEESVAAFKGSASSLLTETEVVDKYTACFTRTLPIEQADQSVAAVLSIDSARSVREVVDLLVPP